MSSATTKDSLNSAILLLMKAINHSTRQKLTGLMSLFKDVMKSVRVTCSFSARSMSTSTVDVAWNSIRFSLDLSNGVL